VRSIMDAPEVNGDAPGRADERGSAQAPRLTP
jgi:hypothetical protein